MIGFHTFLSCAIILLLLESVRFFDYMKEGVYIMKRCAICGSVEEVKTYKVPVIYVKENEGDFDPEFKEEELSLCPKCKIQVAIRNVKKSNVTNKYSLSE